MGRCGAYTYDRANELCCKHNDTGQCNPVWCPQSSTTCNSEQRPGLTCARGSDLCPASGGTPGGDAGVPQCNSSGVLCGNVCKSIDNYGACGNSCFARATQFCLNSVVTDLCGGAPYTSTQTCSNGHVCTSGQTWCGNVCTAAGQHCSNGYACNAGLTWCKYVEADPVHHVTAKYGCKAAADCI
jgi:hypothetical protein